MGETLQIRIHTHIPQEFELASDDAMIRKEGDRLIVDPVPRPSLPALLATLEAIEVEFPDVDADHPHA